ncbi:MAG: methylamine utilization protein [Pseudomonas sp.]|uniref:methylamine utilization protein n=1 Tax=Pseudomonas sp. TaxID=306 RepID=UPI0033919483
MIKALFSRCGGLCRGLLGLLMLAALPASAGTLHAELVDRQGQPLADAVVSLRGPLGQPGVVPTAIMDQVARQFAPSVLAVRSGTRVSFPNSDNIRHQVYSFSPSKRFELRLYQGTPSEPVLFDQPGVVVLGCNIHDWMVGYVYVTDDPWFAVSDDRGQLRLDALPAGRYAVTLWHPGLKDRIPLASGEVVMGEQDLQQRFALALVTDAVAPPTPAASAFGEAFRKATRAPE